MRKPHTDAEKRWEPVFNEAVAARHAGDLKKAILLCTTILDDVDASEVRMRAITHCELGGIYLFRSEPPHPELAEYHFREAVALRPTAELYSLGLFHSLLDQSRWEDALAEVCRYLSVRDSTEYRMVLGGGNLRPELREQRVLLEEARSLVRRWDKED